MGSGLGLSIVSRLCERFGWSIALDSTLDSGTVASVQTARSNGPNLEADVVEQMSAPYSVKANLHTLRTADQMLGTLLDTYA